MPGLVVPFDPFIWLPWPVERSLPSYSGRNASAVLILEPGKLGDRSALSSRQTISHLGALLTSHRE